MLGKAVEARLDDLWCPGGRTPWEDERQAVRVLAEDSDRFISAATHGGRDWRLYWCAGAGVIATNPDQLKRETDVFEAFLDRFSKTVGSLRGAMFVASSAGGVYAGSPVGPPYSEESPTGTRSVYGEQKMHQELLAHEFADRTRTPVVVGRLSNLYGPEQDVLKPQGLVTHVGRAMLRREIISLYVPLDTIRDYLFSGDAGSMIVQALERHAEEAGLTGQTVLKKIFASEIDSSVASVLAAWRDVLKRSPRFVLSVNSLSGLQPGVLSFRSRVWPDLRVPSTTLVVGVHRILRAQLSRIQCGDPATASTRTHPGVDEGLAMRAGRALGQ